MAAAALGRLMADFTDVPAPELALLVDEAPLCWIVPHADPCAAMLMPVIAKTGDGGAISSLLGHFPKRAPVVEVLRQHPRATFLFLGPNGYISPSMVGRDDWAPTWNFAALAIDGDVVMDDALSRDAVAALVRHMEGEAGWSVERLGPRAEELLSRIVGYRVTPTSLRPRFKLGQDESAADYASIRAHLGDGALGTLSDRLRR